MARRRMPKTEADRARNSARARILRAANGKRWYTQGEKPFTMKHLSVAVFRCRQLELVEESTLVEAGFRTRRRPNR